MKNTTTLIIGLFLTFLISFKAFAQPANNTCAGVQIVTPDGTCVAGTTVAATDDWTNTVGCQNGNNASVHEDVWYSFVSTGTTYTGTVTTSAPFAGNVEFILVSSLTGCTGPFTLVGSNCGASPLSLSFTGLTPGTTYYFTVSNASGAGTTTGPFSVCSTTATPPPGCTDNGSCSTPQVVTYTTGVQTCIADCNTGAPAGPDFAGNNCFDFPNATVWYQVTTGANSASIDIALTSVAMTNPYFTVFTSTNCLTYTSVNCTQGSAGAASANVPVAASTTYLIAVSNNGAAEGTFNLCIKVNNDNSACNTTNSLTVTSTSLGSPLAGPYKPGEVVGFCYNITNWQSINCNYLEGIVPTFGNGWAASSFNAQGQPVNIVTPLATAGVIQTANPNPGTNACAGTPAGAWSWFPAGAVTYNNIVGSLPANSAMGAGWYFLSSYSPQTGLCTGDPTDPDLSFGDSNYPTCGTNTLDWNVCFTLTVNDTSACTSGQTICSVLINTYADGEIGAWNSVGCTADASGAAAVSANMCCTSYPTVSTPVVYCVNDIASPLTATGSGLLWYAAATGGVGSATAPTPSTAVAGSTNYYVSQTSGGCEGPRALITVTVNPVPSVANQTSTICSGTAFTVSPAGVPVGTTYTWTAPTISPVGAITGESAQAVGQSSISQTLTNTTTSSATATYTVTPTSGICIGNTFTIVVTVNPKPAVVNQTSTICSATAFTVSPAGVPAGTTYTWTAPTLSPAASITGSSAQGTGQANISQTLTNTTISSATATYTVTPTSGTCAGNTFTIIVTVDPKPSVANQTATICSAAAFTTSPAGVPVGTTYTWTAPTLSPAASITGSSAQAVGQSNISQTLTNTTTSVATATYTVTPTSGTCAGSTFTIIVTVNPTPVITNQTSAICSGTAFTVTPAGVPVGTMYTWTAPTISPAGAITGSSAQGAAQTNITQTLTNTTGSSATATYTVTPTSGSCTGNTFTIVVTVNSRPAINTSGIVITPASCGVSDGAISGIVTTGTATLSYVWNGGAPNIVTSNLSGIPAGAYSLVVTDGNGCTSSAGPFSVTNPGAPAAPTINAVAPVCAGQSFTVSINSPNGSATYTWTGPTGPLGTGTSITINNATAADAGSYSATATITGCTGPAGSTTVTVNPIPATPIASNNGPVCEGTSLDLSTNTVLGATYAWTGPGVFSSALEDPNITGSATLAMSGGTYSVTVTVSGCTSAAGTTTVTVNPNAVIALTSAAATNAQSVCINTSINNITYSVTGGGTSATAAGLPAGVTGSFAGGIFTITGTPTTIVGSPFTYTVTTTGTCTQTSATGTITVNPDATISLTSTAGTDAQTLCINTAISNITYLVSGGGTNASALGLPAGVTGSFAGGVFTISGTPSTTVGSPFTYTVTTSGTCVQTSATGTITVNPDATITLTSAAGTDAQSLCINTAITDIIYSVSGGGTNASASGLPAGVTGSFAGGVFTITGTPSTTVGSPFTYTVTTTGTCVQTSSTGTITVDPDAAIALTSAAGTDAQTLCVNNAITDVTFSVTGGGTNASVSGLPAGVTGSFSGGVFTISGTPTTAIGSPFTYTVTTSGTCIQASAIGTIIVNSDAGIALTSAVGTDVQTVCNNIAIANIDYTLSDGGTNATAAGLPAGVTGVFAGSVFTISGTPTTTVGSPFTYTVTTSGTCVQTTATGTITVDPDAAIALTSAAGTDAQTVCNNAAITNIDYTITAGGTGATVSGLPTGVTGSFAGGVFTITGTPSTAVGSPFTYTVTTTGTCTQATATGTITISSDAVIALTSAPGTDVQTVCNNAAITNIDYTITGGGTNATAAGLPVGVTGSFAAGVFTITGTPTTAVGSPFTYTVTTTGSCAQTTATGTITVDPDAVIALTSAVGTDAQTVCNNAAITNIDYTITGGGTSATASGLPTGVTGSFAGGVFTISGTPTIAVGSPFTYTVTTTGTCAQTTATGTITISSNAAISLTSAAGTDAQAVCNNVAITNITYSVTGGGTNATATGLPTGVTGNFAAGVFTISGTPTTTAGSPFTYTVTTSGSCAQTTATGTITVNPYPIANAGTDINISCGSSTTTLDGTLSTSGLSYTWAPSGNVTANGTTLTPTVNSSGTYTLTVTNPSTTCSATDQVIVTMSSGPTASFSANPVSGTPPLTVTFTNTSTNTSGSTIYSWTFGDGNTSFLTSPTDIYTTPGTYNVVLTASDGGLCPSKDSMTIVVLENFSMVIPNIFTPNGDGNNDVFKVTSTGVSEFKGEIFDRWGLKLNEWSNVSAGWDGRTSSGTQASAGTYYYIINIKSTDNKDHVYTGYVTLVR